MAVTIRNAGQADWGQLWGLLQGMGTHEDEATSQQTFGALVEDQRWLILVAEQAGAVVGYAAAQDYGPRLRASVAGRFGRLHDVYVSQGCRRGGVGRSLMLAVESWASSRVAYLHWQANQERSAPFYEALGYRGDPCPQPDYPEFEVAFRSASAS